MVQVRERRARGLVLSWIAGRSLSWIVAICVLQERAPMFTLRMVVSRPAPPLISSSTCHHLYHNEQYDCDYDTGCGKDCHHPHRHRQCDWLSSIYDTVMMVVVIVAMMLVALMVLMMLWVMVMVVWWWLWLCDDVGGGDDGTGNWNADADGNANVGGGVINAGTHFGTQSRAEAQSHNSSSSDSSSNSITHTSNKRDAIS